MTSSHDTQDTATAAQGPLAFISRQARPYRAVFAGSLFAAGLSGILGLAPFLVIYAIVEALEAQQAPLSTVALIAGAGTAATFGHLIFAALANIGGHRTAFAIQRDLRQRLLEHIAAAPVHRIEGRAGEIKKTVLADVDRLEGLLAHVLPDIVAGLAATVAGSLILAAIDWRLFLASLCLLPVAILAQIWMYSGRSDIFEQWNTVESRANSAMLSYVRGIATLRAFNRQASTLDNLRHAIHELRDLAVVITRRSRYAWSLFNSVLSTNLLVILPLALLLHSQGAIGNGGFVLAVTLGAALLAPLNKVVFASMIAQRSAVAVARIRALLDIAPLPDRGTMANPAGNTLVLEDVSFAYPGGEPVLHNLDLTIAEGSNVAIVGPSGAGKSTLARLLLRMEDPTAGRITMGGADIREIPLAVLRSRMGAVFQDCVLFHGTIAENLALSANDATQTGLANALARASAGNIVSDADATLALHIGDRGQRLSGGEKQRIAIARALVKDAPVLLLDEATASVDAIAETAIRDALSEASSGRTVITIAHRLDAIREADCIVVLEGGRIEATGRYDELAGKSAVWRRLHDAQQRAVQAVMAGARNNGTTI